MKTLEKWRQYMKINLLLISILMFSITSVQAETYQPTDWYVFVYHEGCVPMSEIYELFPYFTGAKTPQEWLDRLHNAPSGSAPGFGWKPPVDAELRPFIEVMEEN